MIESRNSNETAPARRGSHRGPRDGAWRDRRRRDVADAAPDRTIYARARCRQSGRARTHRKRGVRRRSSRAGRLRRGGRPLLLPHSRRGAGAGDAGRGHTGGEPRRIAQDAGRALYRDDARRALPARLSGLRGRGARAGPRRWRRLRRALGAHAARDAGHRRHPRAARRARHAACARHMTEAAHPTWRLPPTPALLVALLLIACAEIGGASMVRFKLELARWARGTMLARPEIHGLVGVRDVDEQIMDEALTRFDGGLRLFHMHAEGMGTIVILTTMVAATWAPTPSWRRTLVALLTVGGAGYPLGYLVWAGLIPLRGVEDGKRLAEWLVWIPFGGTTIVAMWLLVGTLALQLRGRSRTAP